MKKIISYINYFSKTEIILWSVSMLLIVGSFVIFDRENYLTLAASVIGGTSLIFAAKGNPFGQILIIIFSFLYGWISFHYAYYGEMITYLGMTAPMALFSLISWLKHPYKGNKSEVTVNCISRNEIGFIVILTLIVTIVFYFILKAFDTANMIPSTISVTTSFLAIYLTFRRSAYYAIAYAANDIVLMILWIMAALDHIAYVSVVSCFAAFLINDIYGYISWQRMYVRQNAGSQI